MPSSLIRQIFHWLVQMDYDCHRADQHAYTPGKRREISSRNQLLGFHLLEITH